MTLPAVTVAVPTYNAAKIVTGCLSSLEAQNYPHGQMHIVVGDNGSVDGTRQIIADRFPNVEVVTATERGSGYARNAAFHAAQGCYICSIDADCVADPGWVRAMVEAFEAAPDSVACFGGQIQPFRTLTVVERWPHAWVKQETLRKGNAPVLYAETPNAAYRRSALDQVGLFDGTQGMDDTDLGMRLTAAGFQILYAPAAIVRHRNPASIRELYNHRRKYGVFMTRLARKHPQVFGDPDRPGAARTLALQTGRRIAGDLLVKLPHALVRGGGTQGTRVWPLLDAVLAAGNYVGTRNAQREVLQ